MAMEFKPPPVELNVELSTVRVERVVFPPPN